MALIRWLLRWIIDGIDLIFQPGFKKRSYSEQRAMDQKTSHLTLYQFRSCPFCVRVRWALRRAGVNVALRDAKNDTYSRQRLLTKGGKLKVPCLHIDGAGGGKWMYESADIVRYLEQNYS